MWDDLHQQERHFLRYPDTSVVRFLVGCPTGMLLDLGCGAGRHVKLALEYGHDVTGCDISEHALARAESVVGNYSNVRFVKASMLDLPFRDRAFDTVICFGVIYYSLPDDMQDAVDEIHRVLHPGGKAFILTRTTKDRRYGKGKYIGDGAFQMTDDRTGEEGMIISFLDLCGVTRLMSRFSEVTIDKTETSRNGEIDSDWLVTAVK